MKRMTPRTCLWPLAGCLVFTFCLSIGLTYRSNHHCYAGVCGEWLFPLQARLHVVVWYAWTSLSVTFLGFRAFRPSIQRLTHRHLGFTVPLLDRPMYLSGALLILWILSLYGIIVGIWWIRLRSYFEERGAGLPGNYVLAAIALTGHLCDVTMGMALLPVSRNSAFASFFKLSPSTTFTFHMLSAYLLFALIVIHGSLYASWAALYNRNRHLFRAVYPVLNPTYLYHEVWPGGRGPLQTWRASLIFTGSTASLIMMTVFFTSFPSVRRKYFNLFYFTHLTGIVAVVVICLHASTMFYITMLGLAMWVLDWGMRIYELSGKLDSRLSAVGNGWYCLTLPLPRKRLSGCACHSPLAHFYIHHADSSIREIHPFTTITHLASKKALTASDEAFIDVQFLFRKSATDTLSLTEGEPRPKPSTQWTNKLASLVDDKKHLTPRGTEKQRAERDSEAQRQAKSPSARHMAATFSDSSTTLAEHPAVQTTLRLEGPYFTPATPANYRVVICLVAGTGLSGALSIAAAFRASRDVPPASSDGPRPVPESTGTNEGAVPACTMPATREHAKRWEKCVVLWSVREADYAEMPFVDGLQCSGFEFRVHKTGAGRPRLDTAEAMRGICGGGDGAGTWVYISGPGGFIDAGAAACRTVKGLEWFAAKWD